ncbi:MAG: hypothetical protein UW11_C0045G0001 [Parcubacteria group bacterium GW2011_GWA2_43_9b]|nr:MAG: hypothetical protein UW11_C0045G0001 [Parcubacteria group bacterium GW2011_GWA2_43_9b]
MDKEHYSFRYVGADLGLFNISPGTIPWIKIRDDEELPVLAKLSRVWLIFRGNQLESSRLGFEWQVKDSDVVLATFCPANDARLISQYKNLNGFGIAEQIIDLIMRDLHRNIGGKNQNKAGILFGSQLLESEIPAALKPFVDQVKRWKKFLAPIHETENIAIYMSRGQKSQINGENYYLLPIPIYALTFSREVHLELFGPCRESGETLFDFDPQKQPPSVDEAGAWWELPDEKVIVVLFHDYANERVARYYGYESTWQQFKERQGAQRKREAESYGRLVAEETLQQENKRTALLSNLLRE